jgi:hypothetical protein
VNRDDSDLGYYAQRAAEEQAAAERCANGAARQVHQDLARRYQERASGGREFVRSSVAGPLLTPTFGILG